MSNLKAETLKAFVGGLIDQLSLRGLLDNNEEITLRLSGLGVELRYVGVPAPLDTVIAARLVVSQREVMTHRDLPGLIQFVTSGIASRVDFLKTQELTKMENHRE